MRNTSNTYKNKFLLLLLFLSTIAVSQTSITKELSDFTSLKIYSGIQVELVKSDKQELVITGKKSEEVKVKNLKKTLKITFSFLKRPADNTVKAILYYTKDIPNIYVTEGAIVTAKSFKQTTLTISAQDDALVNMLVDIKYLTINVATSASVKLSGKAKNTGITTTTNGLFYGFNLATSNICTAKAGLGGKIEILAGEVLDAKVSFGGTIFYKGTPGVLKTKKVLSGIIEAKN